MLRPQWINCILNRFLLCGRIKLSFKLHGMPLLKNQVLLISGVLSFLTSCHGLMLLQIVLNNLDTLLLQILSSHHKLLPFLLVLVLLCLQVTFKFEEFFSDFVLSKLADHFDRTKSVLSAVNVFHGSDWLMSTTWATIEWNSWLLHVVETLMVTHTDWVRLVIRGSNVQACIKKLRLVIERLSHFLFTGWIRVGLRSNSIAFLMKIRFHSLRCAPIAVHVTSFSNTCFKALISLSLVEVTGLVHYLVVSGWLSHVMLRLLNMSHLCVVLNKSWILNALFGVVSSCLLYFN